MKGRISFLNYNEQNKCHVPSSLPFMVNYGEVKFVIKSLQMEQNLNIGNVRKFTRRAYLCEYDAIMSRWNWTPLPEDVNEFNLSTNRLLYSSSIMGKKDYYNPETGEEICVLGLGHLLKHDGKVIYPNIMGEVTASSDEFRQRFSITRKRDNELLEQLSLKNAQIKNLRYMLTNAMKNQQTNTINYYPSLPSHPNVPNNQQRPSVPQPNIPQQPTNQPSVPMGQPTINSQPRTQQAPIQPPPNDSIMYRDDYRHRDRYHDMKYYHHDKINLNQLHFNSVMNLQKQINDLQMVINELTRKVDEAFNVKAVDQPSTLSKIMSDFKRGIESIFKHLVLNNFNVNQQKLKVSEIGQGSYGILHGHMRVEDGEKDEDLEIFEEEGEEEEEEIKEEEDYSADLSLTKLNNERMKYNERENVLSKFVIPKSMLHHKLGMAHKMVRGWCVFGTEDPSICVFGVEKDKVLEKLDRGIVNSVQMEKLKFRVDSMKK